MGPGVSALPYAIEASGCFAETIGERGIDRREFATTLGATRPALDRLRAHRERADMPLLTLATQRNDLAEIEGAARRLRGLDDVVLLGTGGSSLGGRTLAALADGGLGPASPRHGAPRLWFVENVDPDGIGRVLDAVKESRTGLVIVSKSGGTAETLAQAHTLLPRWRDALGASRLAERVTVVTEPRDNPLRRLAKRFGVPVIAHDPDLGGRYSVLSVTAMLPAMLVGVDVHAVRAGAAAALDAALVDDPAGSPPAAGAALNVALQRTRGVDQTVMMPYLDRLAPFAQWFCQLWAESLGKNGHGTTPIRALGTVDQHSQLQLYLDGPPDKLINIVMGDVAGAGPRFARDALDDPALDWLAGRTLGDLLDVSQRATAATLAGNGRPVRVIRVGPCDAHVLGAVLMHFMLETIITAHLLGVDPFDQPAVEQGKVLARKYLKELS
ncbi:MAG TPA: glucose-6-phosphate isomerase [Alphaproteobacteria bacterium]|nr:glucose-6-phosphate isomerase [Alphaproteobacteria bacterium]